ncbi:MAG TPA: glycosyltransferase 87 family protein, partial [Longimicrobium sp.]|nr:glycosyltransferase 87 family protein [Longimicrobium sp.]
AFLRQDWLFCTVLALCLARRRRYGWSGAALGYAALLRVFPILFALGWAVSAFGYLVRRGRLMHAHRRLLLGMAAAAVVVVPLSAAVAGEGSWAAFYHHTIRVHGSTPLTNNMGLPVALAHGVGSEADEGRLKYTRDERLPDPLAPWKERFAERMDETRPVLWVLVALALGWFVRVARRARRPWIALGLGQVWPVLLLPLTCYYYAFFVMAAPLTRARRSLEIPLLALAAASQVVWWAFWWNDDRYAALSVLAVAFCCVLLAMFSPGRRRARERVRHDQRSARPAPVMAPG